MSEVSKGSVDLDALVKAAEQGDANALYKLARMYRDGESVPKDDNKAALLYVKAAELGHEATWDFLMMTSCDSNIKSIISKMAENGNAVAQELRGWYERKNYGDMGEINEWYKLAVNSYINKVNDGDPVAMYRLGYMLVYGHGTSPNKEKATDILVESAKRGYSVAQFHLGEACAKYGQYWSGTTININSDAKTAISWYTEAAKQGHSEAQHALAECYINGRGVPKDLVKANYWYTQAAMQDDGGYYSRKAQCILGDNYFNGNGVPKDVEKAVYWYSKASESSRSDVEYKLADIYATGNGIPKDMEKAHYWYTKAAEYGNDKDKAAYHLGINYANGEGVLKDLEKAKEWLSKSKVKEAKQALAELQNGATLLTRSTTLTRGCYVATCVYGSYDCPEVWTLRRYRDNNLSASWFGKCFIQAYYAVSPKIVKLFGNRKWFVGLCKPVINMLVNRLQNSGIANDPYSDV